MHLSVLFCKRIRFVLILKSAFLVWLCNHLELKNSAGEQVFVSDVHLAVFLAVEEYLLYVTVFVGYAYRLDGQLVSVRKVEYGIRNVRSSEYIFVTTCTYRIESESRENVPGAHLSAVVISTKSVHYRHVHFVHYFPNPVLSFPRLVSPGVEIWNVMARFVSVDISSYETILCNIFIVSIVNFGKIHTEQLVHLCNELFLASEQFHHSVNVVRGVE